MGDIFEKSLPKVMKIFSYVFFKKLHGITFRFYEPCGINLCTLQGSPWLLKWHLAWYSPQLPYYELAYFCIVKIIYSKSQSDHLTFLLKPIFVFL